jgi:hypothetical protein
MHNNLRSEVSMEIGGKVYSLRPTFQALCEIETSCNMSVITLLMKFDQRGIFLKELVAIVRSGLRGAGHRVPKNLVEILHKKGFTEILPMICNFLKQGLNL